MLKKIFKDLISVLLISFISFAFVSCEGIFNSLNLADTNSEINFITKDGKIIVKGNVNLQGAVPENMSKTAMPDFSSITYVITATPSEGESVEVTALSDGSFSIELYPGSYSVKVEGYKTADTEKKTILKGKYVNAATEDLFSVNGDVLSSLHLTVSPVISAAPGEDLFGTVNLSIGLTDSIIKSWKATWSEDGASVEKKQSSSSFLSSINFNLVADGQTEQNKKVGSYYVTFELFSEENYVSPVLLFSEMINVFENADTSMWISHGASDFIQSDGTMTIAKTQLENRVNFYVNQSTGNSLNPGSYFQPLDNIQDAVDRIIASNDGSKNYTIYICEDYTITDALNAKLNEKSVVYIYNRTGKNLNINLKSYGSSIYKIDCNNFDARSVYANANNLESHLYLTLENIQLCNAKTDVGGGLLVGNFTDATIKDGVSICNNKCTSKGGAVNISGTTGTAVLHIDGGSIYSNTALNEDGTSGFGGAIFVSGGTVNFNSGVIGGDSVTYANTAYDGGAIYLDENCTFNHNGGIVKNNKANKGAGVYLANESSNYNLADGSLSYNTAENFGGGIYQLDGIASLSGGSLSSNTSARNMSNGACIAYSSDGSSKLILKDNINIASSDAILSFSMAPVYIGGNITTDDAITVWFYTPTTSVDPAGKTILKNFDDTDYVKENYSKFKYIYTDYYKIDSKGIVRKIINSPSIESLKPEGITLPSESFTLPADQKELTLSTAAELKQISLWSKSSNLSGYTFIMTDDIDLENASDYEPIGSTSKKFNGCFNGLGHNISNLTITGNSDYMALFGYGEKCVIENVVVTGNISGGKYSAGIVSYLGTTYKSGIVRNCVSYVDVTSNGTKSGGICGYQLNGTIEKCVNLGTVSGSGDNLGGITGYVEKGTVTYCVNLGTIDCKGSANLCAGITGQNYNINASSIEVSYCYNAGEIVNPKVNSGVYGYITSQYMGSLEHDFYLNNSSTIKGFSKVNDSDPDPNENHEGIIEQESLSVIKNNTEPFNTWTCTVIVNGESYPVPVKCPAPVNNAGL